MSASVELDLSGQRLHLTLDDDDVKVLPFYVEGNPVSDAWAFLLRPRADAGTLVEWTVTPSGTPTTVTVDGTDYAGVFPVSVTADTTDFGEGAWAWALFRDTGDGYLPAVTGRLTVRGVVQDEEGS